MSLVDIAEPFLADLRDQTGEAVKMAVLNDTEMVYIARFPSIVHPAVDSAYVGSRLPAAQTCTGRAILAELDPVEAKQIISRSKLRRFTEQSLLNPDEIMAELEATRSRGFSINDQGTTIEHRSAAVALINASGHAVGAINFSVSAQRITLHQLKTRLVPKLVDTAAKISALLPPDNFPQSRIHFSNYGEE
jgi:IclR family pca regulon transcriptional regulator